jgi:hypothetical protein
MAGLATISVRRNSPFNICLSLLRIKQIYCFLWLLLPKNQKGFSCSKKNPFVVKEKRFADYFFTSFSLMICSPKSTSKK